MTFNLTIIPDEKYYSDAYREYIITTKFKKYEPVLATIFVVFGVILYFYDNNATLGLFALIPSAMGLSRFYLMYSERKKWIKDRLNSKISGQQLVIEFNDTSIKHIGPFSNGEILWSGINNIIKTENGILIKPENGTSIYLPETIFSSNEQIDFIMTKRN